MRGRTASKIKVGAWRQERGVEWMPLPAHAFIKPYFRSEYSALKFGICFCKTRCAVRSFPVNTPPALPASHLAAFGSKAQCSPLAPSCMPNFISYTTDIPKSCASQYYCYFLDKNLCGQRARTGLAPYYYLLVFFIACSAAAVDFGFNLFELFNCLC